MAITAADVALWKKLRAMGVIPPAPAVVEIGQANWFGDVPTDWMEGAIAAQCAAKSSAWRAMSSLATLQAMSEDARACSFGLARLFWLDVFRDLATIDAIDLHGEPEAIRYDLNTPVPADLCARFDVLVNTGTLEHLFDQRQAWANCHDLVKPGGLMVHGLPWTGWPEHGLYNYQPGFVLDLAHANGYELLLRWYTEIMPLKIIPLSGDGKLKLEVGAGNSMIHVAMRKLTDAPFVVPRQAYYDAPLQRPSWRDVQGWLSTAEGEALARLAAGKRVLELGSYAGRSTCAMAETAAHVITVDHHRGDESTGPADTLLALRDNLRACGLEDKVSLFAGPFEALAGVMAGSTFDMAFVDGGHSREETAVACRLAYSAVRWGGTVVLHDWCLESVRAGAADAGLVEPDGTVDRLAWFSFKSESER